MGEAISLLAEEESATARQGPVMTSATFRFIGVQPIMASVP